MNLKQASFPNIEAIMGEIQKCHGILNEYVAFSEDLPARLSETLIKQNEIISKSNKTKVDKRIIMQVRDMHN